MESGGLQERLEVSVAGGSAPGGAPQSSLTTSRAEPDRGCCEPTPCICGCCGPNVKRWQFCTCCWGVLYLIGCAVAWFLHHELLFPAWVVEADDPVGLTIDVPLPSGSSAKGVVAKQPLSESLTSKETPVVFFGGNGMEMYGTQGLAGEMLSNFAGNLGLPKTYGTYTTSYPGYPPNSGWTSLASVTEVGLALFDLARANMTSEGSSPPRVLLCGWSLGAAAALQVAALRPDAVAGVFLMSPWSTLTDETNSFIGGFLAVVTWPFAWAMRFDSWDSVAVAQSMPPEIPVAIMSPQNDTMIPAWQHRKVFEASGSARKAMLIVPGADHGDFGMISTQLQFGNGTDPSGCTMKEWAAAVCDRMLNCPSVLWV